MERIKRLLQEKGLKVTTQRIIVYQVMERLCHATADSVAKEVRSIVPTITVAEKMSLLRRQIRESIDRIDEHRGILHIRRHLAATPLFKGIPNFRETRIAMLRAETYAELDSILDLIEEKYLR